MSGLPQRTLHSRRMRLRAFTSGDVDALFEIGGDPEVMRYVSKPLWTRREQAIEAIERFHASRLEGTGVVWAMADLEGDRVFGYFTIFGLEPAHRRAMFGYALARQAHGKRLASEALPKVLVFAFDELGLRRLEADVDPRNVASRRLLERVGFVEEGLARERYENDGQVYDSVRYGLLARELTPAVRREGLT